MKKICLVAILLSAWAVTLKAQTGSSAFVSAKPLILVNGIETDMQSMALNPRNIKELHVLKEEALVKKYGEKGKSGVLLITMKTGTEFYTITDFVNPEKAINKAVSKIQLDDLLLPDMKKLLVDKSIFKQTTASIQSNAGEADCSVNAEDTLVLMTTLKEHKE